MNRFLAFTSMLFVAIFTFGQNENIGQLSSTDLSSIVTGGKATLIDVRTRREFANGHIAEAGQLNYYALDFKKKLLLLPKDQPIYLYCNTGYRSQKAAEILKKNAYDQIYNLEHGIMEWNLFDLPLVLEPDASPDVENMMEPDEYHALLQSDKSVFIDFYAPWCGPCRKMMPLIDSMMMEYKDQIRIVKINVDASKRLVKELQIVSVPYLVSFNQGQKQFEHFGFIGRDELDAHFIGEINLKDN